ncbi:MULTISPECIES: hypothetical protein [Mycolicibacter]|uniref:Uncharacterized protein n=2 Tax=Mycolicibacter TaxID=1073531 RepID=A0ABU5XN41_9MYCO|nr:MULTISPECIES: hypothetical protein [unclassified Mycolicibacter]MEB3023403.1 hypothetical protein [Mycolicibacter sp. MYC098]MEB3033745.1 hypothetical protein [Mycolicibacter sp. MYC340]
MYVDDMVLEEAVATKNQLQRRYHEAAAGSSEQEQLGWDIEDLERRIAELSRSDQLPTNPGPSSSSSAP